MPKIFSVEVRLGLILTSLVTNSILIYRFILEANLDSFKSVFLLLSRLNSRLVSAIVVRIETAGR